MWLNEKLAASKSLMKAIDKEEFFCFRAYSYTLRRITKGQVFKEESVEISVVP